MDITLHMYVTPSCSKQADNPHCLISHLFVPNDFLYYFVLNFFIGKILIDPFLLVFFEMATVNTEMGTFLTAERELNM